MPEEKVKFDPGFSKFSAPFPQDIPEYLEQIAQLPQPHQKKFNFQKLETQAVAMIKKSAYVYLGCMLWGSYIHYRYKDDPREISGNVIKESNAEVDYVREMDEALLAVEKMDKASKYYLRRPMRLDRQFVEYLEAYREFVALNNSFLDMETTADIKIPEKFRYLGEYSAEQLDELRDGIYKVIESDSVEGLEANLK